MKSALVLVVILTMTTSALAQTQPAPLRDAVSSEAIRLARTLDGAARQPATPDRPDRQRSWPARHPVLTGTLIGLGIGVPIGAATCNFPGAEGPCDYYTYRGNARMLGGFFTGLLGAGLGAGVGALIGWATREP
jgi:hypothetical protein